MKGAVHDFIPGVLINESVDLIGFSFEIEAYEKFYHRHIVDIPRIKFFL